MNILKQLFKGKNQNKEKSSEKECGKKYNIGDLVTYGKYPQGKNGETEPIEWIVTDIKDSKVLLLSKYALDCQPYHHIYTDTTWEKCSIRNWLNTVFLDTAFTPSQQEKISDTRIRSGKNPVYGKSEGNNTDDKIFLLSITQIEKYYKTDDSRKCIPTQYTEKQGALIHETHKNICFWWLRSRGSEHHAAASVDNEGVVNVFGDRVNYEYNAVRPAMWIDIDFES